MNGHRAVPYGDVHPGANAQERHTSIGVLLKEFGRALAQSDPAAHRYLLLLRFLLADAVALALVAAAAGQDWIGIIFKG